MEPTTQTSPPTVDKRLEELKKALKDAKLKVTLNEQMIANLEEDVRRTKADAEKKQKETDANPSDQKKKQASDDANTEASDAQSALNAANTSLDANKKLVDKAQNDLDKYIEDHSA